jgi:alpha-L-fucosidase
MAKYNKNSPWYNTPQTNGVLDAITPRNISPSVDDIAYQIDSIYNFRPDLLSNDIYETPKLWWVFAMRNPNELRDPVFDFVEGNIIMVPTITTVKKELGL